MVGNEKKVQDIMDLFQEEHNVRVTFITTGDGDQVYSDWEEEFEPNISLGLKEVYEKVSGEIGSWKKYLYFRVGKVVELETVDGGEGEVKNALTPVIKYILGPQPIEEIGEMDEV